MIKFSQIIDRILTESVDVNNIIDAMDRNKRVIIQYVGEDGESTGSRYIDIYAYGLSSDGNPVIRAFQPFGDTNTKVPAWKFFRLDRISSWKTTDETFSYPKGQQGLGKFNPDDIGSMKVVYKVTDFKQEEPLLKQSSPKKKSYDEEDILNEPNTVTPTVTHKESGPI